MATNKQRLQLLRDIASGEYNFAMNKPKRLIFDHLPKCGGRSLQNYLRPLYPRRKTFRTVGGQPHASVEEFKAMPESQRHKFHLIMGHKALSLIPYSHPDSIVFTVIREPIDRIVSHYHYAKQDIGHYLHKQIHSEGITLEDYIGRGTGLTVELSNWYTQHFAELNLDEVLLDPDSAVERAFTNIREKIHILGFQDDLKSAIDQLQKQVGLKRAFPEKRANTSKRPRLADVPCDIIDRIKEQNQHDLVLYKKLKQAYS